MLSSVLAERYAKALFAIGQEKGTLPSLLEQLGEFNRLTRELPELREAYQSPILPAAARRRIIDGIFDGGRGDTDTVNFLKLLADKKRTAYLPGILAELIRLSDEANGVVAARVTTAVPLDEASQRELRRQLEQYTGKAVRLELEVDPKILGGLVVRIEHRIIDSSVRFQLETLRQHLRQSGNQALVDGSKGED